MHIKLGQKNVPRDWQTARFVELFDDINMLAQDCDLVVNGGDIFDRVPTLEELQLYFDYVSGITTPTIIYSGNHEMTTKTKSFLHLLTTVTNTLNPIVSVQEGNYSSEDFDIIPYECLKQKFPQPTSKLLFTHVRGNIPPHVKSEIDLELFRPWKLVLAGDLHSHSNSQRNIVYPGSPLTTSFHRNKVTTGVIKIDTETLGWDFIELDLPQLIRKTVKTEAEIVPTVRDHTIYEIEGNAAELSLINKDSPLLDKTVLLRESKAQLELKDMSIEEELDKYLKEVVNIRDTKEYLKVYHDTVK